MDREHWRARLTRLVNGLDSATLSLEIHPGDQMYTHSLVNHGNEDVALSQYFAISMQQFCIARQMIDGHFGAQRSDLDVLDFACGFGRLLRLLPARIAVQRTWGSELQPEALRFVADAFGVRTIASHADPAQFEPGRAFDLIWVASLFSHLPESLFVRWLQRLVQTLAPGGLLCFSVRDPVHLPVGETLPANGLRYVTSSENAELDTEIYGTTYASETFVGQALAHVAPGLPWARIPRALANEQDLYVVANSADANLDFVRDVRRGPWGWVDIRRVRDRELDLQGWAASLDDGEISHLVVNAGGAQTRLSTGIARPDVAQALGDARTVHAGWTHRAPATATPLDVEVLALDRTGHAGLLFAGQVE